ncbi:MAG: calcium-binding protein [Nitrospirota bacterium]
MYDLQQAMARDRQAANGEGLKGLIEQFIATTDTAARSSLMDQILFKWTGSDGIDPNSRGGSIDARKLAVLEKFFGQPFVSQYGVNPIPESAILLKEAYRGLSEMMYSQLMAQTHLKPLYEKITYTWDDATQSVKTDMSAVIADLQNSLTTDAEQGKQLLGEFSRTIRGFGAQEMMNYLNFRETFINIDPELGWIIDSAGLPIIDLNVEGHNRYPHFEGITDAEAIKGSVTWLGGALNGSLGNDVIYGTTISEFLINESGNATLVAGGADDTILAGAGDDILDGGSGNDMLFGEAGNDTYIFRVGSGQDTIIDSDPTAGNTDKIWLGSNLTPDDITLRRIVNDLVVRINDTTDKLTVRGFFKNDSPLNRIEQIQFMDGTIWDVNEMYNRVALSSNIDDVIYGSPNNDTLRGFDGDDTIYGQGGNDVLYGDSGLDKLYGGAGEDILDGGTGNDTLDGGTGNDTYIFGRGSGQDIISDNDATPDNIDTILFDSSIQPSAVSLRRNGEDLILKIADSTDQLTVKNYFLNEDPRYLVENIKFADGTVWDADTVKKILLQGKDSNDTLIGYSSPDIINGMAGNDQMYGRTGGDILDGGMGDDYLYGEEGNDVLDGGDGNDTIHAGTGDDILNGGAGNDVLIGGTMSGYTPNSPNGSDTYKFGRGSGQDTIIDRDASSGNVDTILLNPDITPSDIKLQHIGEDLVLSITGTEDKLTVSKWFWNDSREWQVERIQFADGTVLDVDAIKQIVLQGTEGDDILVGNYTDEVLKGLGGNDIIYGRRGNDVLDGGTGNDNLFGEAGNDTLTGGEGNDTLYGGYGNDTYIFSRGSGQDTIIDRDESPGNIDTIILSSDITPSDIRLRQTGDDLVLSINGTNDTLTVSNWFRNDTKQWQVERIQFADGTIWDIDATKQLVLQGSEGDDILYGFSSSDVINGMAGNDRIYGREGDDILRGNAGDDKLFGEAGNDTLQGGEGDDTLYGHEGDDIINGGAGNDQLYGGLGNDTYIFSRGSGQDTIIDTDTTAGNTDTILIADDILPADILTQRRFDDLVLSINGTADCLIVKDWFLNDTNTNQVERIQFADGTIWDVPAIKKLVLQGTEGNDTLIGYNTGDVIQGFGGNDNLYGQQSDDTLEGGAGNDYLYGEAGNDILRGGEGSDILIGGLGDDISDGGSGDDYIYDEAGNDMLRGGEGNDILYSGEGNDMLDGGAGNDSLYGGAGNDTYIFGRGSGQDIVWDYDATTGNIDTVLIDGSIQPSDISLTRSGDHLVLSIKGTTDSLTVKDWFNNESPVNQVERIQFADGTMWDVNTIKQIVPPVAPNHGVTIYGTGGNDILTGGTGDDRLYGDSGNDVLDGGAGNDTLNGGAGNDTYKFGRGSGVDTIADYHWASSDINTVEFGEGITRNDVDFIKDGNNLRVNIKGAADSLILQNWFSGIPFRVDQLKFSDGSIITAAEIETGGYKVYGTAGNDALVGTEATDYIYGYEGNDTLQGSSGSDNLIGGAGDDYLYGDSGNDMLDGGMGNDTLQGGEGNDTYKFGRGSGQDKISQFDSTNTQTDTVEFAEGITKDDLDFIKDSNHLRIAIKGTNDSLTMQNWFSGIPFRVDQLKFSDGSIITAAEIETGGYKVYGTAGNDALSGTEATDYIYGYEGNDTLQGSGGNDTLTGGSGDDRLYGEAGNDALDGGAGNDTLNGGAGSDTYKFGLGSGVDTISEYDYVNDINTVEFGEGITRNDVDFIKDGNNLRVNIKGTADSLILQNWFSGIPFRVDQLKFSDGSIITTAEIETGGYKVYGTAGNDALSGTEATDYIYGYEGNDTLQGSGGNDTLTGGSGDDRLYGEAGNDALDGGAGNDTLNGGAGSDTYKFGLGSGVDTIADYDSTNTATDIVEFAEDMTKDDLDFIYEGNNLKITIKGTNDSLTIQNWFSGNYFKIDQFRFADGTVLTPSDIDITGYFYPTNGTSGNDTLSGTNSRKDILNGGAGNDTLTGNQGDILVGGAGNDTYQFNAGNGTVTIDDQATSQEGNRIVFGAGVAPDDLHIKIEDDTLIIQVGSGSDSIRLSNFNPDDVYGTHAVETFEFADGQILTYRQLIDKGLNFTGTESDYMLSGTDAPDHITTLGGDDIITGGPGNDTLEGGSGNDTYVFNLGDGIDTINDIASEGAGNIIQFGEGITVSDLTLTADGNTLVIQVGQGGDALRLEGFNPDDVYGSHIVETFGFADGTILSYDDLIGLGFNFTGTTNNDTLTGTSANDTFRGGTGNDVLTGGSGDDTYVFNPGDGVDTISDESLPGQSNTLIFGQGIKLSDITLSHDPDAKTLIINIGDGQGAIGDRVELTNFNSDDPYGPHAVEYFQFSDGTVLTYSELIDKGFDITGTAGDDTLIGTAVTDHIIGNSGNDTLSGGSGNDTLTGGEGDDTYLFNKGDGIDLIDDAATSSAGNTLIFGEGITIEDMRNSMTYRDGKLIIRVGREGDEVHLTGFDPDDADLGSHAVEMFKFSDGTTISYRELVRNTFIVQGDFGDDALKGTNVTDRLYGYEGFDRLEGKGGNDTLTGGTGNDELIGGEGSDTYVFNLGDGVDTIQDTATETEGNLIVFGEGITKEGLKVKGERVEAEGILTIEIGTDGDAINILDFNPDNPNIRTIEFSDGTQVALRDLLDPGTEGDDVINTGAGNDVINAKGGNDIVNTDGGNDTINGGIGNDTLNGGAGDDTYIYNIGDGIDRINDTATATEGNTLVFGTGITPDSLSLSLGSLLIKVGNEGDEIHIENFNPDDAYGTHAIETFKFADGTTLSYNQLIAKGFDLTGTTGDDIINGTNVVDRITTFEGNDIINAGDGNDVLQGNIGNDILNGGTGDDTYIYNIGDGLDSIDDISGADTLQMGSGIDFDHTIIRIQQGVAHLRLLDIEGNETTQGIDITLKPDGTIPVETIGFADGSSFSMDDLIIQQKTTYGTKKSDIIRTGRHDDTIYAGKGGDTVYAGLSNDTIFGEKGNDKLYGEQGNDTLYGDKGNDLLDGGNGNDILYGGKGKDTLIGGKGDDIIYAGKGKDTVIFNRGDGHDTIKSYQQSAFKCEDDGHEGHEDRLKFDVNPLDLIFSRSGDNLEVIINGGADKITIEDWNWRDENGKGRRRERDDKEFLIDEFRTTDGRHLHDRQVDQLIQAMATFTTNNGISWSDAIQQKPQEVNQILVQYWEGNR